MRRVSMNGWVMMMGILMVAGSVRCDEEKPTRGEDSVDVPAIGDGLCVHNLFQSNMVIQRDRPIRVWGWAAPGESVTVSFADRKQSADAGDDRRWDVTFPAMPASTDPRQMVVKGAGATLTLENILVGDVWLLGGQSNMEFPLARIENGELEIVSANYAHIRILTVPSMNGPDKKQAFARLHEWSGWFNRHYRKGDWDVCSPEIVRELSAIGYVFARRVHMAARVPIGVIDVSRGGTTVETWTPASVLKGIDTPEVQALLDEWGQKVAEYDAQKDLEERVARFESRLKQKQERGEKIADADKQPPTDLRPGPAMNQNRPGNCYASMIAPIAGLAVKGAIFHQGYNNCFNGSLGATQYAHIFPKMIAAWRAAFNDPDMPFGIISLCTQGGPQTRDNFLEHMADAGPYIREAQYKTFLDLYQAGDRNIGFASTYDLRRRWYHPQLKIPAGERIARWALSTQYGFEKQIRWKPPMVTEMTVEEGRILLRMDDSVGAVDDGGPMVGFAVAGDDRRFHPAESAYHVTGKDSRGRDQKDMKVLVLSSPMVPNPIHYRYAWARSPMANLQAHHNTDVPMATQRSDDWAMHDVPITFGDTFDRQTRNEVRRALQLDDVKRRLKEAQTFIDANREQYEKGLEAWNAKWGPSTPDVRSDTDD